MSVRKNYVGIDMFSVNQLENNDTLIVFLTVRKIYQTELICL